MSDQISVDPDRCNEAAGELETLRDVLSANVPTIVNTLNMYWSSGVGHPESLAVLSKAQGQAPSDATTMRVRARLAAIAAAGSGVSLNSMVSIPGDVSAEETLDAREEAQALAKAEASDNPKAAMLAIQAIQQDIQDHIDQGKDGNAWLAAFYNQAAPQVANLATFLHKAGENPDMPQNQFTILTQGSQQIMTTFANGLATTDKAGLLSPQAVHSIADSPDIWSSAMLVKFGPPGSQWATQEGSAQPSLLAQITNTTIADEQNGTLRIPLGGPYTNYEGGGSQGYQQLMKALTAYDPVVTMLQADTQNKNAAMQVMAGPEGATLAKMLLSQNQSGEPVSGFFQQGAPNSKGQYPGYFQLVPSGSKLENEIGGEGVNYLDPNLVGNFLNASTSGGRGGGPANLANPDYASALAAMNIIDNTPAPSGGEQLDPAIQQALLTTADRYMLDLGKSTSNGGNSQLENPASDMPLWHLMINGQGPNDNKGTALSNFLEQICSNKSDAAALDAAAKVTFGNIYAQTQMGTLPNWFNGSNANNSMAGLLGRIQTEANNVGVNLATDTDAQHEEYNQMLELGEDTVKFLPGVGDVADTAMDPLKDALSLFGIPTDFSTDNASTAQQVDSGQFADQSTQIHVSMVQGLLNNNAGDLMSNIQSYEQSHPGSGSQFLQGNQIVLNKNNYSAFQDWYNNLNPQLDNKYGLSSLESRYGYYYNQQGGTSSQGGSGIW